MAAIFLQKRSTAIGTRMAPAYANLFMHHLESQLLNLAPVKPYLWLKYIDDIFMIWTAGEQSLLEFLQLINQLLDNIKFTWDWSKRTINYLDVQIINISTTMVLLKLIYTLSLLISISTCSILHVIQRGLKKASPMHRPLGSVVFSPPLLRMRTGQLLFKSIWFIGVIRDPLFGAKYIGLGC